MISQMISQKWWYQRWTLLMICSVKTWQYLQTDIDGSFGFLLNAITIQSLEKYLKTFYTPSLDIDQISSIWDQILRNSKTMITVAEELWDCARKISIIPFSIFMSMFHQRITEHRFLESTLELLQQFYIQVESVAHDYKVFPGDQSKFSLICLHCGKKLLLQNCLGNFYSWHPWLFLVIWKCCHQSFLSMIHL